jgi:hypothetical protein
MSYTTMPSVAASPTAEIKPKDAVEMSPVAAAGQDADAQGSGTEEQKEEEEAVSAALEQIRRSLSAEIAAITAMSHAERKKRNVGRVLRTRKLQLNYLDWVPINLDCRLGEDELLKQLLQQNRKGNKWSFELLPKVDECDKGVWMVRIGLLSADEQEQLLEDFKIREDALVENFFVNPSVAMLRQQQGGEVSGRTGV